MVGDDFIVGLGEVICSSLIINEDGCCCLESSERNFVSKILCRRQIHILILK